MKLYRPRLFQTNVEAASRRRLPLSSVNTIQDASPSPCGLSSYDDLT